MGNLNKAVRMPGRLLLVATLAISVTACGLFPDRSLTYRDEPYGEPLQTPEGADASRFSSLYPIPEALAVVEEDQKARRGRFDLPAPPDLTAEILDDNYVVEESGDQVWLLVNDVPGRVWPAVSSFLTENGIRLEQDNPSTGIKQTGVLNYSQRARQWLDLAESNGEETLRVAQFRISHGVRARSTEVQVRLQPVAEPPQALISWLTEPQMPERERQILEDMATYFSEADDTKAYSRVALDLPRERRVNRITEDGALVGLEMKMSHDRAWFEISRALSAAEVPVLDINRSEGLWFVDFRDRDERRRGWFRRGLAEPEYTFLLSLETVGDTVHVAAERAPDYTGTDRSRELLRTLLERLQ